MVNNHKHITRRKNGNKFTYYYSNGSKVNDKKYIRAYK